MSNGHKLQNMTGGYVMYRRVYNKNDMIVRAMLGAGLEEFITSGFTMEEITDRRLGNRQFSYGPPPTVEAKQIRVPQFSSGGHRRSLQLEQIMEELYQMERDITVRKTM